MKKTDHFPRYYHPDDAPFIRHYAMLIAQEFGQQELQMTLQEYGKKYQFLTSGLLQDPKRNNQIPRKKCNAWLRKHYANLKASSV